MPEKCIDAELLQSMQDIAPIDEVDITNEFLFAYVMRDPELCRELLEYLLPGRKIHHVKYLSEDGEEMADSVQPESQKALAEAFDKRGVRLDVYLDDGTSIFNVEMQVAPERALPQRARLYQAHMDIHQLDRGHHFDELKPSFVIFICKFDPFGKGLYRYTFENACREDAELSLRDEAYKLFFNTTGTEGDISEHLRSLLEYMNDTKTYHVKETDCDLIRKNEQAVGLARKDDAWRRAFMTYQIHQRAAELRGIEIGEKRGIAKGVTYTVEKMLKEHLPPELIARVSGLTLSQIGEIEKKLVH